MRARRGVITILVVFLIAVAGLFVLASWQSRLLLAVQRRQSLADLLAASYRAESEVYDWTARFYGGYPEVFDPPLSAVARTIREGGLADGTQLTVVGQKISGTETLTVVAKRQFATTRLELERTTSEVPLAGVERVEVTVGLDCSGSMDQRADPGCRGGGCVRRIRALQTALMDFLEKIMNSEDADKFYVGLLPFKRGAAWLPEERPTRELRAVYDAVRDEGAGGVNWNRVDDAGICRAGGLNPCPLFSCGGETNLGVAQREADVYFGDNPVDASRVVRAHILFTDGFPNTSFRDTTCGTVNCSLSEYNGGCLNRAINYMKCFLAAETDVWDGTHAGRRPEEVSVYGVTVAERPAEGADPDVIAAYDRTLEVLQDTRYVKKAYANENATKLPEIFANIFEEISESVARIKFKRIVPTPVR